MRKAILLAVFFLASCGGPEFAVKYKYVPPADNKVCLETCDKKFNACVEKCSERRERCLEKVRKEAEQIYREQLREYSKQVELYNKEIKNYQNELLSWNDKFTKLYKDYRYFDAVCRRTKDYVACNRRDELRELLEDLNDEKPKKPVKPEAPSFERILARLQASCNVDCGCKDIYDACFTSCGGKLIPYKFCVKNCK